MQPTFSVEDLQTPEGTERVLRQFARALTKLGIDVQARQARPSLDTAGVGNISQPSSPTSVVDVNSPEAPVVGVVYQQADNSSFKYHVLIGVDVPTSPAPSNWNNIISTQLQIATNSGFTTLNGAAIYDRSFADVPPLTTPFSTNYPGTYYIRARVLNLIGYGAYTTITLTTDLLDGLTDDTDLIAGTTPVLAVNSAGSNTQLGGNEILTTLAIPTTNTATYFGYTVMAHNSATLPVATTQETGTAGSLTSGVAVMTDATKAWTVNAWAGKDLVVFSNKRSGSPSFDYEGQIVMAHIISNTATTITFSAKSQNLGRTQSGLTYYVVNNNAGDHFWEKLKYATPCLLDDGVTGSTNFERSGRVRSFRFPVAFAPLYCWWALYNAYGVGKVTATPPNISIPGITTFEVGAAQVTAAKITLNAQGWTTNIVFSASSSTVVNWTSGTIKFANGTSYSISSGTTGTLSTVAYIYFDTSASSTVLQLTTNYANVTGENVAILCIVQNYATDTSQTAIVIPAIGALGLNGSSLSANSITTNILAANAVTAAKISVAQLDAISVNAGTITAGTFIGTTFKTATTGARIEIDSTNGLRSYDASNNLLSQIPVTGGSAGYFTFQDLRSLTAAFVIQNSTTSRVLTVSNVLGWSFTGPISTDTDISIGILGTAINSSAAFVGTGGVDAKVNCYTNSRSLQMKFVDGDIPTMATSELIVLHYTAGAGHDNNWYLLYKDNTGTIRSSQLLT